MICKIDGIHVCSNDMCNVYDYDLEWVSCVFVLYVCES